MDMILRYLLEHVYFVFQEYKFKFVDSETTDYFGGNAYVVLSSGTICMTLVNDRGQLLLDFENVNFPAKRRAFSVDLVKTLITGDIPSSAVLDESYAVFLRDNFGDIIRAFSDECIEETAAKLKELQKARAKRMFKRTRRPKA